MLFIRHCLFCGFRCRSALFICPDCEAALPRWQSAYACRQCGHPFPAIDKKNENTCGACLMKPPHFDALVAGLLYRADSRYLLWQFKFHHQFFHGRLLTHFLLSALKTHYENKAWPQLLIPVPLHRFRLFRRGFNQSVEIARCLSRELGIILDKTALMRTEHTRIQHRLSRAAREKNVKRAFALNRQDLPLHVALIDDVVTTGSTVNILAKLLKAHGVEQVDIWCTLRASENGKLLP